jgi:hypothetical protein
MGHGDEAGRLQLAAGSPRERQKDGFSDLNESGKAR